MVVICTPLMKKVHKYVKGSSEIAFVDSGGCMDRHSSKIFLVMTPSVAGALLLGIIVTSSEAEDLLKKAFLLWKSILPENAFFGKEGPAIFMTDDCKSERNTLNYVFPHAILLLCIFHVLQAVWRWLLDSNHGVCKTDKPILYHMFKDVLNSETKEKCQENYEILKNHPASQKQSKAKDYFSKLMLRVSEWALSYRMEYLTRGHNTNNYCEATMRVLKDHIFFSTKAFSLVQLFHFLTTRIDKYFERRIAAVLNNRVENYVKSRYHIKKEKFIPLSCSQVSQNIYTVSNSESKMTYTVNTEVEICTCPVGKTGAPCKHQYAVVLQFNLSSNQFLPFSDEKAKRTLYKVISDSSVELPQEWFTVLRSGPVNPFAEPAPVSEETDEVETSPAFENGDNVIIPNADVSVDNEPSANECADVADSILDEQFQEEDENEKAERIARCLEDINRFSDTLKKGSTHSVEQNIHKSPDVHQIK
ncbi:hypothetical protein FOCC_FOCC016571 [Frankliniella occidentalis]|nr:hypothetical protein FOCC_FOCC016571 [Frankliniella occidentalis]